ncbi:hypothetical protein TI39_contig4202g00032 [Zymoseptoria brevis]|uniref:Uncharacterized protein n=1 Tax=Zymoseptoria brevis TaxID=1047168 RepID=A0A0F4GBD9_9PEZI|nr:hypothetical protein TI39_contig4202g00032 [Zymoseptoria brevis]
MSRPRPSCGLFDTIPLEIREMIYAYTAGSITTTWRTDVFKSPGNTATVNIVDPPGGMSGGLANTNKILRAEMDKFIDKYGEFTTTIVWGEGAPAAALKLPRIPSYAQNIHLRVEMQFDHEPKVAKKFMLKNYQYHLATAVGTGPDHLLVTFHFAEGMQIGVGHEKMMQQFELRLWHIAGLQGYKIQAFEHGSDEVPSKEWSGKKIAAPTSGFNWEYKQKHN